MNERTQNLAVGITAMIGIVGLLVMMLLFGYVPGWLESGYTVRVLLPNASGLSEGSRVKLSGIDIGVVEKVHLQGPPAKGVVVVTRISPDIRIPQSAEVSVTAPLLGGSPTIEFQVAEEQEINDFLPTNGTAVIDGEIPSLASAFSRELQAALQTPMEKFDRLSQSIESLAAEWESVGQNINQLIEPREVDGVDRGESVGNLATVIARADQRLAEMEEALAGINRYVNNDELYENITTTAANARQLSETVATNVEELESSITENVRALRLRYAALADDLSGAISTMQQLVDEARAGEGTLGRLVQDPAIYDNINDAAQRMRATVDDLRLLIQKWRAEGLPVQF